VTDNKHNPATDPTPEEIAEYDRIRLEIQSEWTEEERERRAVSKAVQPVVCRVHPTPDRAAFRK
jgi:hypothetical protein